MKNIAEITTVLKIHANNKPHSLCVRNKDMLRLNESALKQYVWSNSKYLWTQCSLELIRLQNILWTAHFCGLVSSFSKSTAWHFWKLFPSLSFLLSRRGWEQPAKDDRGLLYTFFNSYSKLGFSDREWLLLLFCL